MPYIPSLDYIRGLREPAPIWRWVVALPQIPITSSTGGAGFPVPYQNLSPVSTVPFGIAHRVDFQPMQIGTESRFYGGRALKFARHTDNPNMQISFYEDVDYSVMNYIKSWQNLIVDANWNYGAPETFKKSISFFAFDSVSNTSPVLIGTAEGCWPPNGPALAYTYEESGPVTLQVEFCVDGDYMQFNNSGDMPNSTPINSVTINQNNTSNGLNDFGSG